MEGKRYAILDSFRGLILISMITYHTVWDMVYIFGEDWSWYKSDLAYVWQQSICCSFILLSGFCWSFGRVRWKRGVTVFMAGVVISVVTALVMPDNRILFGVLTLLGSCMLLMIPMECVLKHIRPAIGLSVSLILFFFTRHVNDGYWGFGVWELVKLPRVLYNSPFMTYLGFPEAAFFSADYFSLIPWSFLFIGGYFLYGVFVEQKLLEHLNIGKNKVLEQLGKHSLVVYMLHQPLVYGVLRLMYM